MKLTRTLSLLLCAILLLGLCACGSHTVPPESTDAHTTPATEPVQITTEPPVDTEPAETLPSVQMETRAGYIPFLAAIAPEETGRESKPETIRVHQLAWDVERGGLTEPAAWYDLKLDSLIASAVPFWAGGSYVATYGSDITLLADGVQVEDKGSDRYCGNTLLITPLPNAYKLVRVLPDGTKTELPTPTWPDDLYQDSALELMPEPFYAWTDGETVFVLLMAYDDEAYATDMVYTTYSVDAPEEAVWRTASVPFMQAVDVLVSYSFAWQDGCLYAASLQAVVKLDTTTGEISTLDTTNLFQPVFALLPDAYWHPNSAAEQNIYVLGCWQDTLIFELSLWTDVPEQTVHTFYVAVRNGEIQGVMERTNWEHFTFYDGDMNLLCEEARYTELLYPMSMKFPLDES